MKFLVLFGSASDEAVYNPLLEQLKTVGECDFEIISAHRDPEKLDKRLKNVNFDAVIAGAGLAAHLPGVIASKTEKPVFGIPVSANFGGLDSLLSIQQMPFGIPVLTAAQGQFDCLANFLNKWQTLKESTTTIKEINIIIPKEISGKPHILQELARIKEFTTKENLKISVLKDFEGHNPANIVLTTCKEHVSKEKFCIHVPILDSNEKNSPAKALDVFDWVNSGGLWVGVNNTRNAIIAMNKLFAKK